MNYNPSDRVKRLRDRVLTNPPERFQKGWHLYYYLQAFMNEDNRKLPFTLRHAKAYANVVKNMPCEIYRDDILAGEHFDACEIFAAEWSCEDINAWMDENCGFLPESMKEEIRGWMKENPMRFKFDLSQMGSYYEAFPDVKKAVDNGVISIWGTSFNHSIRGYDRILKLGFKGIKAEVQASLDNLDPKEAEYFDKRLTLTSWLEVCDACMTLGKRYAQYLYNLAEKENDATIRNNYLEMAKLCERVPAEPATNYKEAVQALWFGHMMTIWEDGSNANGIGRIDQLLYPFYKADKEKGLIDEFEAKEFLSALWIKLYLDYDVQQTLVGGQTDDGKDGANDISYFAFDVTEALGFIRCLSARLHKNITDKFLSRCVDLFTMGGGIPFFYNDEALIPALVREGIPYEDAIKYAVIGCVEITLPGMAFPHAVSNWVNHSKIIELAINNGKDMITGEQLGPDCGNLRDFKSMADIKAAFDKEFEYFENMACGGSNYIEQTDRERHRLPYLSLLTEGCIEKATDILKGGAKYNWHETSAVAIPNAGDAFYALERLLFTDKVVDADTLLKALKADFKGYEDLYDYIVNKIEKYGNDCEGPDAWVTKICEDYCLKMDKHSTICGGKFFTQLFSFTIMLEYGKKTAASVGGRHAGTPLAYSLSPGQGRDIDSITATIKSLAKIKHELCAASTSVILELDPSLVSEQGKDSVVALLRSAIDMGVGQLQFNVVSKEKLIEAKKDPTKYPSLAVRVSGFSQKFCLLEPDMQDHIIARTKHKR
ncbi:MAG: hypothetical protein KBT47_04100 [Armatimonadetes bacterium]|nr:hypothetical protein [Candidatus Hippobium faecium]